MNEKELNKLQSLIKGLLKSPRVKWIVNSDILLSEEDILQEVMVKFLESKHQELLLSNIKIRTTFIINSVKNIKKANDASKRGGDVQKQYIEELTEPELFTASSITHEGQLRQDVRSMLFSLQEEYKSEDIDLLVDYYALGLTQSELATKHGYKDNSYISRKVSRILKSMSKDLRKYFLDLKELRSF